MKTNSLTELGRGEQIMNNDKPWIGFQNQKVHMSENTEAREFWCEASDLRIPPGKWPAAVATNVGNAHPFLLQTVTEEGGAEYRQEYGIAKLRIFND